MGRANHSVVFGEALLPQAGSRWSRFGASLVIEVIAVGAVIVFPMLLPQRLTVAQHFWVMPLETPHAQTWQPQPAKPTPVKPIVVREISKPKPVAVEMAKPRIYAPVIARPVAKLTPQRAPTPEVQVAKPFPEANPQLSLASSAIPTLKRPREEVQTGGFGDPSGVPDNGKTNKNPNIAQLGSYDLPAGAGNGTGGLKGDKAVVSSTGFGNGVAMGNKGANHGAIQQGLFGDESKASSGPRVKQMAAVSSSRPVEILFKPQPAYTDEARAKKIEGEVLLQVVFAASGDVRVERVVQGLGYGLDTSAESSARQIRFRPAEQEGQLVDSSAIVHITFQLAY